MPTETPTINQMLRDMIAERDWSVNYIAKKSGVDYKGMYEFIHHNGNLHYKNMLKLMVALGYRVTMIKNGTASASRLNAATNRKDEIIDISKL